MLQTYRAPEMIVTFDPRVCIHSGVCLRTLSAVFDASRSRWITPELADAKEVAAAIDLCPSGALNYKFDDSSPDKADS
jgi:uncharacterized Fe-S cluster protein YjdI